ncbi:hypothetical protein AB433_06740 [Croceicoccus naphthovorans]|uniref:NIPSNAP domain-containing protein n=2 Tax=Croceicoccus naphthovorans TaxID=1348774 RepID=A0A0G3XLV9_9SPHN|nr:hypothetical protein AB433_06740 [Croceicoccus naphthovorans]
MLAPVALAAATLTVPQVALAQDSEWPMTSGEYVDVAGISIDDGHGLDYAKFLAATWRKGQEFAKSQGWITGYEVMYNVHPRKGEPDVYLLTRFVKWATPEEEEARGKVYRAHMAMTESQMQAASAGRAEYRHVQGSMLLQVGKFK